MSDQDYAGMSLARLGREIGRLQRAGALVPLRLARMEMGRRVAQVQAEERDLIEADPQVQDWRSLPRKAPEDRREARLSVRVSHAELEQIKAKAQAHGLGLTDYVVESCLMRRLKGEKAN